ncbi:MAG TPA: TRAP transporter small permease [Allosphingosinicella sp.]|jgi:TRAP-type C4-dicarboxylate transport system permease small subunit|nr:TRAP transporter small permease [Allosphingosinicella sp.]
MRLLDKVYAAGIILAAIFMVLIAGLTLAQVVGRLFGVVIPDAGDIAGYSMAGATFLALAHTFRSGGHIRVNLLLTHVPRAIRRVLEVWCVLFLCVVGALFAGFSINMVLDSYAFGDVSTGMMAIPLWVPQLSMAVGAVLLEIAALEELVRVLRGEEPHYARAEGDGFTE